MSTYYVYLVVTTIDITINIVVKINRVTRALRLGQPIKTLHSHFFCLISDIPWLIDYKKHLLFLYSKICFICKVSPVKLYHICDTKRSVWNVWLDTINRVFWATVTKPNKVELVLLENLRSKEQLFFCINQCLALSL